MHNKFSFYLLAFLLATNTACTSKKPGNISATTLATSSSSYSIAYYPEGEGYYALLEHSGNEWSVADVKSEPITHRNNPQQEILFVSKSSKVIAPFYDKRMGSGDHAECTPIIQTSQAYGLCNSSFAVAEVGMSIGKNIVSCATALCLAAGTWKRVDPQLIQQAALNSNLIAKVQEKIAEDEHTKYLAEFSQATTIPKLQAFSNRYRNNDPDGLIPKAQEKLAVLEQQSTLEAERRSAELRQLSEARQKAKNQANERAKQFRESIKVGHETNCGPVIEMKGTLIKIYFPIKDYGNEHWLRLDEVYPKELADCRFVNGVYQPPS